MIGIVFIGLGLWGLAVWFPDFLSVVRGLLPISVLLGGIVALVMGVSAFQPGKDHDEKKKL